MAKNFGQLVNESYVVAQSIRELGEVSSGELYARLIDKYTLDEYNTMIDVLKNAKLITEEFHKLKWIKKGMSGK